MGRRTMKRGPEAKLVDGKEFRLADEVPFIQDKAVYHVGRLVTIGRLILFSTNNSDAWLLDVTEHVATRLARDGDPGPVHLEETDSNCLIECKGQHRIESTAFAYHNRDTGRVTTILGYPARKSAQAG